LTGVNQAVENGSLSAPAALSAVYLMRHDLNFSDEVFAQILHTVGSLGTLDLNPEFEALLSDVPSVSETINGTTLDDIIGAHALRSLYSEVLEHPLGQVVLPSYEG